MPLLRRDRRMGLRRPLAGWSEDRPLWTGSCPCQPFSVAGKGGGVDDPRHLWPDFLRLIRACRPPVVVGEQVAGKAGYGWLDGVRADLAGEGYAGRGVDIPACAVDAPHIRQRLYWDVADRDDTRRAEEAGGASERDGGHMALAGSVGCQEAVGGAGDDRQARGARAPAVGPQSTDGAGGRPGSVGGAHLTSARRDGGGVPGSQGEGSGERGQPGRDADRSRDADGGDAAGRALADADVAVLQREPSAGELPVDEQDARAGLRPGSRNGTFWSYAEWIACHDAKARRTEPGSSLLAHGVPARVAKWRGFGNAIVPQEASEVIGAWMDVEADALEGLF
jgi:DNA (cytosine-5)-methyltransferase 1